MSIMKHMDTKTKQLLIKLADENEKASFCLDDPSCFLRTFRNNVKKTEVLAFAAANLSFGRREQFIPKIDIIKKNLDELLSGKKLEELINANNIFPQTKFYRFYSYSDINQLFEKINSIIKKSGSLGNHFKSLYETQKTELYEIISREFLECRIVSSGKNCAHKRINMFLRWMVRDNSPVDIGIWHWYPKEKLIIPLDTHVLQQAKKLKLLDDKAKASIKTAKYLTQQMNEAFPHDPSRADYALFGLGIQNTSV